MGKQVFTCDPLLKVLIVVALMGLAFMVVLGTTGALVLMSATGAALVIPILLASAGLLLGIIYSRYVKTWNDLVEVGEDGIRYVSSRGGTLEIRWEEIDRVKLSAGALYVYARGGRSSMRITELMNPRTVHALVVKRLGRANPADGADAAC